MRAAVRAGADAVYFGLHGFNARARATNFDAAGLGATMRELHASGVRGYVTLNTLVFDAELPAVEAAVRACAEAGVDAVIVQDLGVARLVRAVAPELPIHASTQMTCTDAAGVELARSVGATPHHPGARAVARGHRGHPRADRRRARGLRPRGALHLVLGPVHDERGHRRTQRQPRRVCAGVPASVRAGGRRREARRRRRGVPPVSRGPRGERARARARAPRRVVAQDRGPAQGSRVRRGDDRPVPDGHRRSRARRGAPRGAAGLHARLGPRVPGGRRSPAARRGARLRPPRAAGRHVRGRAAGARSERPGRAGRDGDRARRRAAGRGRVGERGRGRRARLGDRARG